MANGSSLLAQAVTLLMADTLCRLPLGTIQGPRTATLTTPTTLLCKLKFATPVGQLAVWPFSGQRAHQQWFHVAETYDGTTMKFYLDGNLQGSATGALAYSNNPLDFGRMQGGGNYFKGWLDEVAISDYAMTADQVQYAATNSLVPEPSALTLLTLGAISLLAYAWRKRK